MNVEFLLKGMLIGFSIAAPVGPIGVLCIRRTLAKGLIYGIVSGLGAATADAVYGVIAAFGLTFISSFLVSQQSWMQLIGGLFLCYLGVKTFLERPSTQAAQAKESGLWSAYATTFFLTLTNPITILSFAAIFAGLGMATADSNYFSAGVMVLGVLLGSMLWWGLLTGGVSLFRAKFDERSLIWVNRISGVIIGVFGLVALGNLLAQQIS